MLSVVVANQGQLIPSRPYALEDRKSRRTRPMPSRDATEPEQDDGTDTAQRVLETATEVTVAAREQLTDAATTAEGAIRRANDSLHQSSDRTLTLVGAFSVGTALGLLIGGSSRFLIAAALAPAALVAGGVMERLDYEERLTRPTIH
jgi:hypothetical protein